MAIDISDAEIIEMYHLKEIGREDDKDLIEFLREGQEIPKAKKELAEVEYEEGAVY